LRDRCPAGPARVYLMGMGHRSSHLLEAWLLSLVLMSGCARRPPAAPPRPQPVPGGAGVVAPGAEDRVAARLRARLQADTGERAEPLRRFYAAREFHAAWRDDSAAARFLRRIGRAADDGLSPTRYAAT